MMKCISCETDISNAQFNNFDKRCSDCAKRDKLEMNFIKNDRGVLKEKVPPEHLGVKCYLCEEESNEGDDEDISEAVYTCKICNKPVCNFHHEDKDWGIIRVWKQYYPFCDKCNRNYLIYSVVTLFGIVFGIGVLIGLGFRFGWFS